MPEVELGKYAFSVLSAWGLSLAALLLLGLVTWRQSLRARRALEEAEARLRARREAREEAGKAAGEDRNDE